MVIEATVKRGLSEDVMLGYKGGLPMAEMILNGFDLKQIRAHDTTLRKDEWIEMDNALLQEVSMRLVAVADLIGRGLTYSLPNAMGTTRHEWEKVSDMDPATRSMDGATRGENDRQTFDMDAIPIYITHKDFNMRARHLAATRAGQTPLDTSQIQVAGRLIAESYEDALINGSKLKAGGGLQSYGYLNYTHRNTHSLATAWNAATVTGENILTDVLNMIDVAKGDRFFGPYVMYINSKWYTKLNQDFKANSDKSIRSRLMEIEALESIKELDVLGDTNNVILVQMTRDVVSMVVGEEPRSIVWDSDGGMLINFKVMGISVPKIKSDFSDRCGIVHASV